MTAILRSLNILNRSNNSSSDKKSVKNDIQALNEDWWSSLSKTIPIRTLKNILKVKVNIPIRDMLHAKEIYQDITREVSQPLVDNLSTIIDDITEEKGMNFVDPNDCRKEFTEFSFEDLWCKIVDYWYMLEDAWATEFDFEDVPEEISNRFGIMLRLINRKKSDPLKEANPELYIMNGVWQSVMNNAENSEYIRNKALYFKPRYNIYIDINHKIDQLFSQCEFIFDQKYLEQCEFDCFETVNSYTLELESYVSRLFYFNPSLESDSRITSRLNLGNYRKFS